MLKKKAPAPTEEPKKVEVVEPVVVGTVDGLSSGHNPWIIPDLKNADYAEGTLSTMFAKVEKWYKAPNWKRITLVEGKQYTKVV